LGVPQRHGTFIEGGLGRAYQAIFMAIVQFSPNESGNPRPLPNDVL